jgi:hypothetical protein
MGFSDTFQNYRVHTLLDWILKIVLMGGVGLAIWAWFKNQALLDQILVVLLITLVITALLDIWALVLLRKTQGIRAIASLATQRLTLVAVIVWQQLSSYGRTIQSRPVPHRNQYLNG